MGLAYREVESVGVITYDDASYLTRNARVLTGLTREGVAWAFSWGDGRDTYFHPVTWLSLMADLEAFGFRPELIHLENLALHALTALLLFLTALRCTGRPWPSLAAALLFGLHPLGVEAVAWITERKTVLATALAMGAVRLWVAQVARPARWRLALVALLFALAVLARPQVVVLPALLLALDVWPLRRLAALAPAGGPFPQAPARALLLEKWPFAAVGLCGAGLVLASLPRELLTEPPPTLGYRLAQAVASVADYLGAMAWPGRLAILREQPDEVTAGALALGALALAAGTGLAAWQARRRPWWLAGWLWFLAALLPALGLVQNGTWPAWADRFAYLPLLGASLAVAFGVAELPERWPALRWPVAGAAAAALLALGLATRAQVEVWQSSETLMRQAYLAQPGSALVRAFYAAPLMNAGRLAEARTILEEALRLRPDHVLATVRLAEVLQRTGDAPGAAARYRRLLALHPDLPDAHLALGRIAMEQGWTEEARRHLVRFLEVAPSQTAAPARQARAWLQQLERSGR